MSETIDHIRLEDTTAGRAAATRRMIATSDEVVKRTRELKDLIGDAQLQLLSAGRYGPNMQLFDRALEYYDIGQMFVEKAAAAV